MTTTPVLPGLARTGAITQNLLSIMNSTTRETTSLATRLHKTPSFCQEILEGLTATPKCLPSKYLYDNTGDHLFQDIMHCEEYYPFNCELDIFSNQTEQLAALITGPGGPFDLIELGAGDCTKSLYLLKHLQSAKADFTYMPIDISSGIIEFLTTHLPSNVPGLKVKGLHGEYFDMLQKAAVLLRRRKVVLFLGCNLGNMSPDDANSFCRRLRSYLHPGDLAVIGLDLKKNPSVILAAYNDKKGLSRQFNINLLNRINRELHADFDTTQFEHFPIYDPESGSCRSYLISLKKQSVTLHTSVGVKKIQFHENEEIYMEISQKYTMDQIDAMARQGHFAPVASLFDKKKWFVDSIWKAI